MSGEEFSNGDRGLRRMTARNWPVFRRCGYWGLAFVLVWGLVLPPARARAASDANPRCFLIEVYYRQSETAGQKSADSIVKYLRGRRGVRVRALEMDSEAGALPRLEKIKSHFQITSVKLPLVYGCNQVLMATSATDRWTERLDRLFHMDVYVRSGCQHCAGAKEFLTSFSSRYPGLAIRYFDVAADYASREAMQRVTTEYRRAATTVPVFHFCNQLQIGFDSPQGMGERLEEALSLWTSACPKQEEQKKTASPPAKGSPESSPDRSSDGRGRLPRRAPDNGLQRNIASVPTAWWLVGIALAAPPTEPSESQAGPASESAEPLLPIPGTARDREHEFEQGGETDLPLPGERLTSTTNRDEVRVPFWGKLSVDRLGLPLFTVAVGLVDGFNPCAMWVLLFLLSLLVNLQDRRKILAVAGTFVVISGLAYFAFMAAWLSVFLMFGLLRWAQVLLALLALAVGTIHIKDFFAFHQGLTLSIPESAKPGIYARVRRIVMAESLVGAILGASTLAVLVNIIELLCTAGLPAMYTEILALRQLPVWMNYLYLGLYIVAYMFDDSIMVGLVVVTLGRRKLQETQGRWLKLLSGSVILLLGVVMLVRPDWLI